MYPWLLLISLKLEYLPPFEWLKKIKSIWFTLLPVGFPGGSDSKPSACNEEDLGSIPGSGRSPGEGNGNLFQFSCLENSMDGGAWWAIVHGVTESQTRLSSFASLVLPLPLETFWYYWHIYFLLCYKLTRQNYQSCFRSHSYLYFSTSLPFLVLPLSSGTFFSYLLWYNFSLKELHE